MNWPTKNSKNGEKCTGRDRPVPRIIFASAFFHTRVDASAVLVCIADLFGLELLAIPHLVVNLVLLARFALTNASSPVWILCETLVSEMLAALGIQTRCSSILCTV